MRRHLHALKHRTLRAAHALWRFGGPVAGSIRGEMCKEEWKRAATKTVASWATAKITIRATVSEPEFWTDLCVPLAFAALTGLNEVAFHTQSGKPLNPDPAVLLPPSTPEQSAPPPP